MSNAKSNQELIQNMNTTQLTDYIVSVMVNGMIIANPDIKNDERFEKYINSVRSQIFQYLLDAPDKQLLQDSLIQ